MQTALCEAGVTHFCEQLRKETPFVIAISVFSAVGETECGFHGLPELRARGASTLVFSSNGPGDLLAGSPFPDGSEQRPWNPGRPEFVNSHFKRLWTV